MRSRPLKLAPILAALLLLGGCGFVIVPIPLPGPSQDAPAEP